MNAYIWQVIKILNNTHFYILNNLFASLIVTRYYKVNAGFFLTLFIVLFGIMSGAESILLHHALMSAATSSLLYTLAAIAIFALYGYKCLSFSLKMLNLPENNFLYNMQGLSNSRQLLLLFNTIMAMYLPIMLYGSITAYIGFTENHYLTATLIFTALLFICCSSTYICFFRLNTTWKQPIFSLPTFVLSKKKKYLFFLLHYSLDNRKGAFITIKIISLSLLQFMVALNNDKPGRENICFLILLCISTHALLPLYYTRFIEHDMPLLRNLPLPLAKRYSIYIFTYALIFLPELLFLLWNESSVLPVAAILSLYTLSICRMSLFTSLQFLKKMTTDKYTSVIFVLFFVTIVLLASVNIWFVAFSELGAALIIFATSYYSYEEDINIAG